MKRIYRATAAGHLTQQGVTLRCHLPFDTYVPGADIPGTDVPGAVVAPDGGHAADLLRAVNVLHVPAGAAYHLGPEQNVDILTWVVSGDLGCVIPDQQSVSLGAGGLHLVNTGSGCTDLRWQAGAHAAEVVQIWIAPDEEDLQSPCHETRLDYPAMEDGGFHILASGFPEDDPEDVDQVEDGGAVTLHGYARVLHAMIRAEEGAAYQTTSGRVLYVVVVSGDVKLGDDRLASGDAMLLVGETDLVVMAARASVVLLVDVAERHDA